MKLATHARRASPRPVRLLCALASCLALAAPSWAATPAELLAGYKAEARSTPSPERGEKFFNTDFKRDMGWTCSSCHGRDPTQQGKDDVSGKKIKALAPGANPARFTDRRTVENAFRLNCNDVVGRECTAAEKADVLAWLISLKP